MLIFYFLNTLCSCGQSMLGKRFARKGGIAEVFNLNKALGGITVFTACWLLNGANFHFPTAVFGIFYGIFLCLSMHFGFKALATGPMALTSIIASFSLIIPLLFGIIFWNERLSLFGIAGIFLLSAAIIMLNLPKGNGINPRWLLFALLTLAANGICSVIQKYHQMCFPSLYRTEFMLSSLITVAFMLCAAQVPKPGKVRLRLYPTGIVAGIMNSAANYLVLYLATYEKASVLFPFISVANVMGAWFAGRIAFREKLNVLQIAGLLFGICAMVLLKI